MFDYERAVRYLPLTGMVFLVAVVFCCLFFIVRSQKLTDKIVAINMIAVNTLLLVVMVSNYIGEEFLVDVALVYGLLSFLAMIVFTRFLLQFKLDKPKAHEADSMQLAGADEMLNMEGMPDMGEMFNMEGMPDMGEMLNMEGMPDMGEMLNMEGMPDMDEMLKTPELPDEGKKNKKEG